MWSMLNLLNSPTLMKSVAHELRDHLRMLSFIHPYLCGKFRDIRPLPPPPAFPQCTPNSDTVRPPFGIHLP